MQKFATLDQECCLPDGRVVKRIFALHDFGPIKKGTIGGYVESVENLSHKGNCWIADDAVAAGRSRVSGDALLLDRAMLDRFGFATDRVVLSGDCLLDGYVSAYGECRIGLHSYLTDGVIVRDHATVMCLSRHTASGKRRVPNLRDQVIVEDHARLEGRILMTDHSRASRFSTIKDHARLRDHAHASSHSTVKNGTILSGNGYAGGHAVLGGSTKLICRSAAFGNARLIDQYLSGDEVCR